MISKFVKFLNNISNKSLHKRGRSSNHTLNKSEKNEILKKQNYLCNGKWCSDRHGKTLDININNCNFDHIIPKGLNGNNSIKNIQALCPNCHYEKTRKDLKKIRDFKRT